MTEKWEYLKREVPITEHTIEGLNALGEEGWKLKFMWSHEFNEEGGVASLYCIFMRLKEEQNEC
jgi:hypothetical protein